jgi:hypothetical protein
VTASSQARLLRGPHGLALLLAAAVAGLLGAPDASAEAKKTCQKVTAGVERAPVYATHIACRRARRIVRRFVARDRLPRGWTSLNPAGCEHVIFRRRDREPIMRNGYRAPPGVPLVATIRMRGCES